MRIAVHAFDGITTFHLGAPLLVFGEVARHAGGEGWETTVWSDDGRAVRTDEGLSVGEVQGPEALDDADLVVFPSWPTDLRPADPQLAARIRRVRDRGAQVAGLCLGAFPVVDSGVLDGRVAVTHWAFAASLAARRSTVAVDPAALNVAYDDVITSAGTASAIDACLHVVRRHLGPAFAADVARHLVVAPHRDGDQAQYAPRVADAPPDGGRLGDTLAWATTQLHRHLTVDDLARHAGMSRRHFTRLFAETTGTSPRRWMLARRLDESRRLLETTSWPITRIATACGFDSPVTFRQNFAATYATTPSSYRLHFAAATG